MSEPVKSVEIEDVLSSIRRLVSDDRRIPVPSGADKSPEVFDRLVLTPALRVAEAQSPGGDRALWPQDHSEPEAAATEDRDEALWPLDEAAPEEDPADGSGRSDHDADGAQASRGGTDGDGADGDEREDFVADGTQDAARSEEIVPETLTEDATEDLSALDMTEDAPGAPRDTAPWSDPEATLYSAAGVAATAKAGSGDEDLGVKIAKLEAVIAETRGHWEPDDPGTDDYAGTEVEKLDWSDTTGAPTPGARATTRRGFVETLEDPGAPVPDSAPETAPETETVVEPVFRAAHRHTADPAWDADTLPDLVAQETILDEATLRDMVAEIVREELQGALGERITRNVRKLVRREIHRALTMQNLD